MLFNNASDILFQHTFYQSDYNTHEAYQGRHDVSRLSVGLFICHVGVFVTNLDPDSNHMKAVKTTTENVFHLLIIMCVRSLPSKLGKRNHPCEIYIPKCATNFCLKFTSCSKTSGPSMDVCLVLSAENAIRRLPVGKAETASLNRSLKVHIL
jgi:hypothetical protein